MSKWKPGQLVTIDSHVYRVVKIDELPNEGVCENCDLLNICSEPDFEDHFNCVKLIGVLCYLKKVI